MNYNCHINKNLISTNFEIAQAKFTTSVKKVEAIFK